MTKNKIWKIIACCTFIAVVIVGAILYFTKYQDFQKSLDEDFQDFEDDLDETERQSKDDEKESTSPKHKEKTLKREYVSIPYEPLSETKN